jgi:predicted transcriptional regulator
MTDDPVADDPDSAPDLATLVDLLDDGHVRTILAATSAEPLSAATLADRCGLSTSAVYRRVDRLTDAGLLDERTRPRSDGHHEAVYVATVERFELVVRDGEMDWTVEHTEADVADELTRLWGKF